jgi:hypothetical protein
VNQLLYRLRSWWGMRKLQRMPPDERRRFIHLLNVAAGECERLLGGGK